MSKASTRSKPTEQQTFFPVDGKVKVGDRVITLRPCPMSKIPLVLDSLSRLFIAATADASLVDLMKYCLRDIIDILPYCIVEQDGDVSYPVQVSNPANCLHTGLYCLDLIFCGGYRRGRTYTHLGLPGAGKSTLIQEGIAAAQKAKIRIFHFDQEGGASRKYMMAQGIKPDDTYRLADGSRGYYYFTPETGDETYQMACNLLDTLPEVEDVEDGFPTTIIFIDSYESMQPKGVDVETNPIGAAARMHSRYQKLIRPRLRRTGACWVATNQIRMKVMAFGNPETDGGGLALQFYADAKTRIGRRKEKKEGERFVSEVTIKCTKNKMADPFYECESRLIIGKGFDRLHDRLEFLTMCGVLEVTKGKYTIEGKQYPYGKARALMKEKEWIKTCRDLRKDKNTYDVFFGSEGTSEW